MAQVVLSTTLLKQNNYAAVPGDLALPFVAMDAVNGNAFFATGREVLVFWNTDATPHTVTISSVADALGRIDTSLTNHNVPANSFIAIQMSQLTGWTAGGKINLATSSALIKAAVLQIN